MSTSLCSLPIVLYKEMSKQGLNFWNNVVKAIYWLVSLILPFSSELILHCSFSCFYYVGNFKFPRCSGCQAIQTHLFKIVIQKMENVYITLVLSKPKSFTELMIRCACSAADHITNMPCWFCLPSSLQQPSLYLLYMYMQGMACCDRRTMLWPHMCNMILNQKEIFNGWVFCCHVYKEGKKKENCCDLALNVEGPSWLLAH